LFTELLSSGSRNVNPQNVEDWKNYWLLQEIVTYLYIMLIRQVYF
jgi:hypothetical protein